ncbi:MAG: Hsp33 family molecular chaperone HslO [Cocleimonas sp.]|nr:Hsp33 family molecular chaperone HslO [Cocleimonas sp.]
MPDKLQRFLIDNTSVRGELVQLDQAWQRMQATADYPAPLRKVLGEALAAISLLATTLKFDGSLILQIHATAPVHMLVVQATSDHTVRGLARWNEDIPDDVAFQDLFKDGRIIISVEPKNSSKRYQSIVELKGNSLADSLTSYFQQSEQLPTRLWLVANDQKATGLLLQRLPETGGMEENTDNWEHALALTSTITDQELLTLESKTILKRLYHEEELRVFEEEDIVFECQCSQQKIEQMVISLGLEEANDIITKQGNIEVDCEFCNNHYLIDKFDVLRLFSDKNNPSTNTLH